jgi:hypothetical protein
LQIGFASVVYASADALGVGLGIWKVRGLDRGLSMSCAACQER